MATVLRRWPIVGRWGNLDTATRILEDGGGGLLIYGPAGVGKSRLAEADGRPTIGRVGTRTAAALPLSAVVALFGPDVPAQPVIDPVRLFEHAGRALRDRYGETDLVTILDDLHLLDGPSLSLLADLVAQGAIFLVATLGSGDATPDLITGLWRDDRLARMDLEDLDRVSVDTLLHLVLGGPMEAATGRQFWVASGGNPLYVRELVLGALDTGVLVEGARHAGYNVSVGDYHTAGLALVDALAAALGDQFDAATAEAWSVAYNLVAECMLNGAADAPASGHRYAGEKER